MLQIYPMEGELSRPTDIRGGSCLGIGSAILLKKSMLRLITPSLPGLVESDLSPIYSTDLNGLSIPGTGFMAVVIAFTIVKSTILL